jgi:hypothetical protein
MKIRDLLLPGTASLLTHSLAVPASAAPGETTATVTVTGGSLSISVPSGTTNLGSRANSETGGTVSGSLGQVEVLDARTPAAGSGWVASVISTTFVPTAGTAIAASAVSYTAGAISETGTSVTTANNPGNLTGVSAAVTASAITGDNSASWNPTIHVVVPGGISGASTTFTATITHSVA